MKQLTTLAFIVATLTGCSGHEGDYFPYTMKGMNSYVYDNQSGKEFFAGYTEASYFSKGRGLASCASNAYALAKSHHLNDWGYVCCTVTPSSSCATKVR